MSRKLLCVAVVSLATVAFAGDPELKPAQEEAKGQFDQTMEESFKAMNEKCGTKATLKSDFHNYKEADWSGKAYYSWCQPVVDAIASMCADRPAYKKALSKKLTGVSCLFGGVKPAEKKDGTNDATLRNMSFDKGVFTFHMYGDATNVSENTRATVEKALN